MLVTQKENAVRFALFHENNPMLTICGVPKHQKQTQFHKPFLDLMSCPIFFTLCSDRTLLVTIYTSPVPASRCYFASLMSIFLTKFSTCSVILGKLNSALSLAA